AKNCDDGNVCTDDSCDKKSGCVALPNTATCTDGSECSLDDNCAGGKCVAGKPKCAEPTQPCRQAACDAKTAKCTVEVASDGTVCGGGPGKCDGGACVWTDKGGQWGLVPAGTFWMGCSAGDPACTAVANEKPQHKVTISKPFWMGLTEATVASYQACRLAKGCASAEAGAGYADALCKVGGKQANWTSNGAVTGRLMHPLNCVTWANAHAYCQWAGGGLPTEAQWELAARGRCEENGGSAGCAAKMRPYPWGTSPPVCGKHGVLASGGLGCGKGTTAVVKTGSPLGRGPYGHYDLAGNVYEWSLDWYSTTYYASFPATGWPSDPANVAKGTSRGLRGGSWYDVAINTVRAGFRAAAKPYTYAVNVGMRCARPVASSCAKLAPGAKCDDGNACTTGDVCKSGTCAGQAKTCDDNNKCTHDFCAFQKGCLHTPVAQSGCPGG
ncbi:MAG: formylglycine-generating enzyme family protein, partial [Myxococcales bacterium]|nr:formylglycine-generating enzyme family protein [Myxococcales bacterium]